MTRARTRPLAWLHIDRATLALLVVATVLRVILVWHARWIPVSDSRDYHAFARSLVRGEGYQQVYEGETAVFRGLTLRAYRMPGYPAFLATIYSLGGWNPRHAYLANVLFELVTILGVVAIGRALFDRRTALVAAGLVAIHVRWTPALMSEALFTALLTTLAWLLVTRLRAPTRATALAYGVLQATATFVRPIGIVALPIALYTVWRAVGRGRAPFLALLLAAPTVLGLAAWSARNWRVLDTFVLSTNFGPHNAKPFGVAFERAVVEVRNRGGGEVEIDRTLRREIWRKIRRDPGAALHVYGDRVVGLVRQHPDWIVEQVLERHTFTGPNGASWIQRGYVGLRGVYPIVYLVGLAGAVLLLVQRRRLHGLWWLFAAYVLLHAAVSISHVRFAAPLYPFICLAAAYAVTQAFVWSHWLVRRMKPAAARGAAALALCAVLGARSAAADDDLNLGFERLTPAGNPQGWVGGRIDAYRFATDSVIVHGGRYAARLSKDLDLRIDGQAIADAPPARLPDIPARRDTTFDRGSRVAIPPLDRRTIESLTVLGKMWGFLKYYHPRIAAGELNWDYELFRVLPTVLAARDPRARNRVLVEWFDRIGEPSACAACKRLDDFVDVKLAPDLEWLEDTRTLGPALSTRLVRLRDNRQQGEHYYVALYPGVHNPNFENESAYRRMLYPDDGFRLLALYRYWNMIQYFFPYRDVIGEDWSGVLREFIPKFGRAADAIEYRLAALELIGRVRDTHANIPSDSTLTHYKGARVPAVQLRFVEGKPVVTGFQVDSLAAATGLQVGDVVLAVDGEPVERWIARNERWFPASNQPTQRRDMARDLLRGNTASVTVEVERDGSRLGRSLARYPRERLASHRPVAKPMARLLPEGVGYVYMGSIASDSLAAMFERFAAAQGLVVDLRCYPKEFVVFSMGRFLVPEPTPFARISRGSLDLPGVFTMAPGQDVGARGGDHFRGKVVILVDETTVSQAEYTAMAFRVAPGAVVVGSTTAGADGNVSRIVLPGGIATRISGIGIYYPDGRETQRVGIVPDIELHPTLAGIRAGRDELLEKAVEIILQN